MVSHCSIRINSISLSRDEMTLIDADEYESLE